MHWEYFYLVSKPSLTQGEFMRLRNERRCASSEGCNGQFDLSFDRYVGNFLALMGAQKNMALG